MGRRGNAAARSRQVEASCSLPALRWKRKEKKNRNHPPSGLCLKRTTATRNYYDADARDERVTPKTELSRQPQELQPPPPPEWEP